ncbi:MAG: leucine-rich repeat domain-containing protein [Spirochaetales bacterium]|nr:leucine-rich repeat domain-containing protein [Spirochaetales bacterium]
MKKKYVFILILLIFSIPLFSQNSPGDVWFTPATLKVMVGIGFTTEVHVNSGEQQLGAYGFDVTFDQTIITPNVSKGNNGVEPGPDGFLAAVGLPTPGHLRISGFDTMGEGPGADLHLLTVNWNADNLGSTLLTNNVENFIDPATDPIGTPNGIAGSVEVVAVSSIGDVNQDGSIDITDALIVAQYSVGLDPLEFTAPLNAGDANMNGSVDIVDAMLIAQYYVGLLTELPWPPAGLTPAPTPITELTVITFPDIFFELAVRDAINKPSGDIYVSDVNKITHFEARNLITNIKGIEHFTALEELSLFGNDNLTDITLLANLTSLTSLNLAYTSVSNLSPLSGLTSLKTLLLYNNGDLVDISPLAGLTSLMELRLSDDYSVEDITPLENLTGLKILTLDRSGLTDITPLSGLTALEQLFLQNNKISDISPLTHCTALIWLNISDNTISDMTPLSGCTAMQKLSASGNTINDITFLADFTRLSELELGSITVDDVTPLSHCTNLTYLSLRSETLSNVAPLSNLTALKRLVIGSNMSDISPLSGLTSLTRLTLSGNNISDILPLATLINLSELGLSSNMISDLTPLKNLTGLVTLGLDNNPISNISSLAGLTNLSFLSLRYTLLDDVDHLITHFSSLHCDLMIKGCNFTHEDIQRLIAELPDCTIRFYQ